MHPQKNRNKQNKHYRELRGAGFEYPADDQPPLARGEMVHHQQRHASQTGPNPQNVPGKISAQGMIESVGTDEGSDDQSNRPESADKERTRLIAIQQPRWSHAFLR